MSGLLPYWIQRADLTVSEFEPVDLPGGLRAFQARDWGEERALESELEAGGEESCPPGIGFVAPTGAILHICPRSEERAMVHYHARTRSRLFGLIPVPRSRDYTKEDVELARIPRIVEAFFDARHEEVVDSLAAA